MTSRFLRLALLLAFGALAIWSYGASGFDRTRVPVEAQSTQTHAPSHSDDDAIWQTASRQITINGSSFQFDTHLARVATLAHHGIPPSALRDRGRDLRDASRDRSPLHQIPLLI